MTRLQIGTTAAIVLGLFLLPSCSSPLRPPNFVNISRLLADRDQAARAKAAAPEAFTQSQKYYRSALEYCDDAEQAPCEHYSALANIKFATAMERANRMDAAHKAQLAQQRQVAARNQKAKHDQRRLQAEERIARMEKILALQNKLSSAAEVAKAEKARLAAAEAERLAAEKARQQQMEAEKAQLEQENLGQQQVAQAKAVIAAAEAVNAATHAPAQLNAAKTLLARAEKALADRAFGLVKDSAAQSERQATMALDKAKAVQDAEAQAIGQTRERESLFRDAGQIPAAETRREQRGVVVTLHGMFKPRKTEILPESHHQLKEIAKLAQKYPNYPIMIEGYTDSRGRDTANLARSQGQATAVMNYLTGEQKLAFARVKAAGYGEADPIADNSRREGRERNRRIQVVFLFQ